jgi:hypothetical protein
MFLLKLFNLLTNFAGMRPLYLFVWWCLSYSLRLFYKRIELINPPKSYFGRTIYMSNHAASFMDPLVVACFRKPIVFFMTRSDVFTPISKPLLWSVHMLPIYRQLDGVNTKEKNSEVFQECSKVLKSKRNLLVFAEGFTDDVFVRRLKPIKKGAVRIGFSALEYMNWSEKVYISAVGCNYSEPNRMRSDLLISTSESICLNDYREEYLANSNKVITELSSLAEKMMQDQITHIENPHLTELHEAIMILTRKGMNATSYNKKYKLKDRYLYSKRLANWLNLEPIENLEPLKEVAEDYIHSLKQMGVTDDEIWRLKNNQYDLAQKMIKLLLLFPLALLGALHCGLPYILVKKFVEKKFKRSVFWGSTKLLLCMILMGFLNMPILFYFDNFFNISSWWGIIYYLLIGLFGLAFYISYSTLKEIIGQSRLNKVNTEKILEKREQLFDLIKKNIPSEFL